MNITEELKTFDAFLKGLSTEQFDNMLENAGINQISSCEESNMTYYAKLIDVDKLDTNFNLVYSSNKIIPKMKMIILKEENLQ